MEKKENRSKIMNGGRFGERDKVEWGYRRRDLSRDRRHRKYLTTFLSN